MKRFLITILLFLLCGLNAWAKKPHVDLTPIELDLSVYQQPTNEKKVYQLQVEENYYSEYDKITQKSHKYDNAAQRGLLEKFNIAQDRDDTLETDKIPLHYGTIKLGGNYSANYLDPNGRSTTKFFTEYEYNRFKLSTELSKSGNSRNNTVTDRINLKPEFYLTDSFSVQYIHRQNIYDETYQQGVGIKYKPQKLGDVFEFSADFENRYKPMADPTHRLNVETIIKW